MCYVWKWIQIRILRVNCLIQYCHIRIVFCSPMDKQVGPNLVRCNFLNLVPRKWFIIYLLWGLSWKIIIVRARAFYSLILIFICYQIIILCNMLFYFRWLSQNYYFCMVMKHITLLNMQHCSCHLPSNLYLCKGSYTIWNKICTVHNTCHLIW